MKLSSKIVLAVLVCLAVPAAVVRAQAPPKQPVTRTPDQMKWVPNPTAPGVMTAVAWGNPDNGPHGAFHKFTAGFASPLHTHTANTVIVVISGTMSMTGEDGKEMKFPAGSFYTQPNTYKHVTKCLKGAECLVFLTADAKWDLLPVEEKK